MKLYLTLEADDGQKVERVIQGDMDNIEILEDIVSEMVDILEDINKPL
jgi:hypothetical protein